MPFNNRPISEIDVQKLKNLIGNQEENVSIEFKVKYDKESKTPEEYKREICKDVSAMANAEGGYILVGVSEDRQTSTAQDFRCVPNANSLAESINGICLDNIDPRITDLEVKPYPLKWKNKDIEIVIIHIPRSNTRYHSFVSQGATSLMKRYGKVTREYPILEVIDAISIRHQVSSGSL